MSGTRKVRVTLQRLSICPCGFPLLDESIPLGTEYEIDLGTLAGDRFNLMCGGCGAKHRDVPSVVASQFLQPERKPARLPYSIFIGSAVERIGQ